ncbi:hypothetical protein SEPB62_02014 [Salmonella enterica subsp. enterica serovar Paratyphi B str. SARA62]|nr:hypothetical protein SEEP3036_11964 [Salmonella enterica subsp. enterica serovar Pullorum str. 13036]ESE79275.1 hypothetical protein SEPB62_02014 [Salmonella enterica subsp. enterica serovar Paratyphi B str. SARA62]ESG00161.1 hypothetical protein SEEPB585_08619 [Salmonella enterica subsp. enterica serovar Paratyphi B str. ATCC BAA-1585]ESG05999.1 hypothetical protein SEEP9945_23633 [Salmonella enterica subsp. enterica serovar Pullorum str. 19945]
MLRLPPGTLPPKYPASAISRNKNVTPYWHYFFTSVSRQKQHPARQGGMLLIPFTLPAARASHPRQRCRI